LLDHPQPQVLVLLVLVVPISGLLVGVVAVDLKQTPHLVVVEQVVVAMEEVNPKTIEDKGVLLELVAEVVAECHKLPPGMVIILVATVVQEL
jgi:hypothetical protein